MERGNGNDQDNEERCHGVKGDGTPCQAMVMEGASYCFFHNPSNAGERLAAQRRGGEGHRTRVMPSDSSDFVLNNSDDVLALITVVINQVYHRTMGPKEGTTLGYLAGIAQKAQAARDIEQRLAVLEGIIQKMRPMQQLFDPNSGDTEDQ
jgi:hypothetical protein